MCINNLKIVDNNFKFATDLLNGISTRKEAQRIEGLGTWCFDIKTK